MSAESKAAAVKNFAIGAAILAALGFAWFAWKKGGQAVEVAKDAGGFLFGADDSPETLGTWLYESLHVTQDDYFDRAQAAKSCAAMYPPGSGKVPRPGGICEKVLPR